MPRSCVFPLQTRCTWCWRRPPMERGSSGCTSGLAMMPRRWESSSGTGYWRHGGTAALHCETGCFLPEGLPAICTSILARAPQAPTAGTLACAAAVLAPHAVRLGSRPVVPASSNPISGAHALRPTHACRTQSPLPPSTPAS